MTTTTEKLLNELNGFKSLSYPQIGYSYFADITGNGDNRRKVYTICNDKGAVFYNNRLNGLTPRKRCDNIRKAIELAKYPVNDDGRFRVSFCHRGHEVKTYMAYFCDEPITGKNHMTHAACVKELTEFAQSRAL